MSRPPSQPRPRARATHADGLTSPTRSSAHASSSAAAAAASASVTAAAASAALAALASPSPALLRHTSDRDRRIIRHKMRLAQWEAQRGREGVQQTRPTWLRHCTSKARTHRQLLLSHPSVTPVVSRHVAACVIQRWWRRITPAVRQKRSAAKREAARQRGEQWNHPYTVWVRDAEAQSSRKRARPSTASGGSSSSRARANPSGSGPLTRRAAPLSASYYLETGLYHTPLGSRAAGSAHGERVAVTSGYRHWCADKIAHCWFRCRKQARYRQYAIRPVYTFAAIDIQCRWRAYRARRVSRVSEADELLDPRLVLDAPARTIQRAYRRFSQRRIFQYFRQLILSRQNSNPYLLLKMLGGGTGDPASGLYLRFRLGGAVFPPVLYYKTFTSMAVTDIGAFAPRDYARDRKAAKSSPASSTDAGSSSAAAAAAAADPHASPSAQLHSSQLAPSDRAYWYRRFENNGWRPILSDMSLLESDPVLERSSAKAVPFHPNKLVRQLDVLRRRRGKKIEWLRKMYTSGVVALPTQEQMDAKAAAAGAAAAGAGAGGAGRGSMTSPSGGSGSGDDDGYDSDESAWHAWKSASAARLSAATFPPPAPSASPSSMLASLCAVDTSSPSALLDPSSVAEWEGEAEALLEWCAGLGDFEAYADDWARKATSRPEGPEYRMQEPEQAWSRSGGRTGATMQVAQAATTSTTAQTVKKPAASHTSAAPRTASSSSSSSARRHGSARASPPLSSLRGSSLSHTGGFQ